LAVVAHRKLHRLRKCSDLSHALSEDSTLSELLHRAGDFHQIGVEVQVAPPAKKQKGETKRISFALFQQGKSVAEIAQERQLTESTVVNHLLEFIGQGVSVSDLAPGAQLDELIDYLTEHPEERSTDVKEHFNNRYN